MNYLRGKLAGLFLLLALGGCVSGRFDGIAAGVFCLLVAAVLLIR